MPRRMAAVDSPANGITLCSGSLGARPDNDLPGMMQRLGDRVHFLHLRNVKRESPRRSGSFYEAEHLGGDTDMVALIAARRGRGAAAARGGPGRRLDPVRPDHGQNLLDDLKRNAQPGYPAIGRLRGLAELRGVMTALTHPAHGLAAAADGPAAGRPQPALRAGASGGVFEPTRTWPRPSRGGAGAEAAGRLAGWMPVYARGVMSTALACASSERRQTSKTCAWGIAVSVRPRTSATNLAKYSSGFAGAVDVPRAGPVDQEQVVLAGAPVDVDVLAQLDVALGAEDGQPSVAPGAETAGVNQSTRT